MKEREPIQVSYEEQKISSLMEALTLSESKKRSRSPHDLSRTGSAPPGFDCTHLFSYLEGDFFTKSFSGKSLQKHSKSPGSDTESPPRGYSPHKYLPRVNWNEVI